jgi:hypothetical protein
MSDAQSEHFAPNGSISPFGGIRATRQALERVPPLIAHPQIRVPAPPPLYSRSVAPFAGGWGVTTPHTAALCAAVKALLDPMVGEARAHVQGESLKARAALRVRLVNSPSARGGGENHHAR